MSDASILVGLFVLAGSIITAAFALRGKRGEIQVSDDANLRDDQREFIAELRAEIATNRADKTVEREARSQLEAEVVSLRLEVHSLREELQQTRAELADARIRSDGTP